MNSLEKSLIEKAGHENGFENSFPVTDDRVLLGSACHRAQATITQCEGQWSLRVDSAISSQLPFELARSFPEIPHEHYQFVCSSLDALAKLLQRAAKLAQALPTQAIDDYDHQIKKELANIQSIKETEIERIVRQRVGQNIYRHAMLDYWGGACAVTGVAVPEVLRASHAKPWKDCANDAERLDVFNGFLLSANLDALFDRCLISFDDVGNIIISPHLSPAQRNLLGLHPSMKLRWIADEHLVYLRLHRSLLVN